MLWNKFLWSFVIKKWKVQFRFNNLSFFLITTVNWQILLLRPNSKNNELKINFNLFNVLLHFSMMLLLNVLLLLLIIIYSFKFYLYHLCRNLRSCINSSSFQFCITVNNRIDFKIFGAIGIWKLFKIIKNIIKMLWCTCVVYAKKLTLFLINFQIHCNVGNSTRLTSSFPSWNFI